MTSKRALFRRVDDLGLATTTDSDTGETKGAMLTRDQRESMRRLLAVRYNTPSAPTQVSPSARKELGELLAGSTDRSDLSPEAVRALQAVWREGGDS